MLEGSCLLGDVTKVLDLGLQTPVPLVFHQERVLVEVSVDSNQYCWVDGNFRGKALTYPE
jgi:hypothetical protein